MCMEFDIMFLNEVTAHVTVKDGDVKVESFSSNPFEQPLQMKSPNIYDVYDFFCDRWYEKDRKDYNKLIEFIGVPEDNIYEIVKKNHGVCYEDFLWLRFKGEDYLKWEDVKHDRD